jgi:hypothetical protein
LKENIKDFYIDWLIYDSLDSLSGPSNWQVDSDIVIQTSPIYSATGIATTILYSHTMSNKYIKATHLANTFGTISLLFKYLNGMNYLALELSRTSMEEGSIKLYKVLSGGRTDIEELTCEKMLSIMPKCFGYEVNIDNNIEIINYNPGYVVLLNGFMIYNISTSDDIFNHASRFAIAISNQNNFKLKDILLRELAIEDYIKFTQFQKETVNQVNQPVLSKPVDIIKSEPKQLKYNSSTNSFDEVFEPSPKSIQPSASTLSTKPPELAQFKQPNQSNQPVAAKQIDKCTRFDKEDKYICNYINKVLSENNVSINDNEDRIKEIIKSNCIISMKNEGLCKQVLDKISPVNFI